MSQEVWSFRDRIEAVIKDVASEHEVLMTDSGIMELNELMKPKVEEIVQTLLGVGPDDVVVHFNIYMTACDEPKLSWATDVNLVIGSR
jgi:hypothetical protein